MKNSDICSEAAIMLKDILKASIKVLTAILALMTDSLMD